MTRPQSLPPLEEHYDQEPSNLEINTTPDQPQGVPDRGEPKLYVDVNIGRQGMERIVVYEGDTADSLATDFCVSNGLNIEMQQKLKVLLDQQIAGVLPKIMEGESSEEEQEEPREDYPPKAETPEDSP